ncbi:hypothetical protein [Prosthecobacter sp.]|uniref:hypothetical protein n=1 Tax=Prosthecobacter sp. TaxID=1965333 RepID=UPI0037844D0B
MNSIIKAILFIGFCSTTQLANAEDFVSHKCADFIPADCTEELVNLALEKHLLLLKLLEENDDEYVRTHAQDAYPLWKEESYIAFGQNFQHSILMLCWFKEQKKAGLFFFEGYTYADAREVIRNLKIDARNLKPMKGVLMYDGLMKIAATDAFPRLAVLFAKANADRDAAKKKDEGVKSK